MTCFIGHEQCLLCPILDHVLKRDIIIGCSLDDSNWSCAYDSIIMGLYSLYHNLSTHDQTDWSMQSTSTHFLAEGFTSIKHGQLKTNIKLFNNLCDDF